MKTIKYLYLILLNIIGIFYLFLSKAKLYRKAYNYKVYLVDYKVGVTLGLYIFIYKYDKCKEDTILHESGHVKQSELLGPLYLFVIGIPSAIHCLVYKYISCINYYDFYTEKWADKLAGR